MPPESEDHADYDEAEAPAAPRCTRLISLDLTGCFHVTDAGIACIGAHCPLLQTLVLDGVRRVSAAGIASVGTNCPRLQRLLWSGILIRSSRQVDGFFSIPSIDRPTLRALLDPAKTTAQLATLHVGNCKCDVNALAALLGAGHAPALTDLNVVSIASDALCQSIGSHCANLRVLRLSRSRYFSEQSFLAVPRGCHELRVLDVENCEQITDKALLALGEHCVHLEKLVVANDWQVTDRGIEHVGRRCARLFSFNVRHCPEVTLPALRAVAATKHNCVEVSSDGLTPKTASVIAFHCQELALEHAATKISRWLRRRWLERSDSSNALQRALQFLRRRKKCAARIQRWFRAQSARRREYRLLQQLVRRKRVALHEREFRAAEAQRTHKHRAATHIQRVCRGFLGRRKARRARAHAEELQRHRERMATAVQRSFRGHQAASQIVRVAMGCLGRRRSKQRAKYLAELAGRQQRGASAIQRAYRAHLTRVLFRRCVHSGAIALQMLFRGFMERRRARALILARAYHLEPRILILNQYAIFNREFAVEWKAKRDAGEKLALAMQRCARGYMGRVLFNAHLAAHRQLWYTRDHAARTLQHMFRSMMICIRIARLKVRLHLRNTSALQIQSTWRMFQGKVHATAVALRRDRHRKLHDTRVTLAASDAMAQSQLRLLQHGAAAIIVWAYRHTLRERGWLSPTQQRFLARQAARIQSIVRGFLDRRRVRRMREELTWVALQLQRAWRGKAGRIRWREAITDKKKRQQLQEEDDRAARVARKLTGQYGLDAYARDTRHAVVLQRWYHTLRKRQVFYDAKAVRAKAMQSKAADKLALVLHLSTESVVFQARVWRDCVERKEELTAMEDDAVEALEAELTQLKQECQAEHLLYSQAMIELNELQLGMRDQQRTKRLLQQRSETIKVRIQPFALQAKELTRESARVHLINRQLQNELQRVSECMEQFHERLRGMLLYEPLLFQGDVTALIAMLDPNGTKGSMVDWEAALEQDAAIQAALASQ
ncbi:TPA: hypothetical protein N0F65_001494 [Lagenidium giganteum]|uniref:Abnormal spindle-like microcephaly-associated protein n=1 Tax=Lagenidium giganteum TaxID=4803 RepID=A0AAV2Z4K4_9STRA|nr:TPA: hypothetical protein N0F65_001494 [Lagenidium giganteum]